MIAHEGGTPEKPKRGQILSGGKGDSVRRSELKLVERAFRSRWPVSKEIREKAIERAAQVIASGNDRNAIAAVKALVAIDRINVELNREKDTTVDNSTTNIAIVWDSNWLGNGKRLDATDNPPATS